MESRFKGVIILLCLTTNLFQVLLDTDSGLDFFASNEGISLLSIFLENQFFSEKNLGFLMKSCILMSFPQSWENMSYDHIKVLCKFVQYFDEHSSEMSETDKCALYKEWRFMRAFFEVNGVQKVCQCIPTETILRLRFYHVFDPILKEYMKLAHIASMSETTLDEITLK